MLSSDTLGVNAWTLPTSLSDLVLNEQSHSPSVQTFTTITAVVAMWRKGPLAESLWYPRL